MDQRLVNFVRIAKRNSGSPTGEDKSLGRDQIGILREQLAEADLGSDQREIESTPHLLL